MTSLSDSDVVIVSAGRTALGRRNGAFASVHPADLLGHVQRAVIERAGIEPSEVGQVIAGCLTQAGEQTMNVGRTAWLAAGLPPETATATVDAQCGSSQQATNLAYALIAAGVVDSALACGVESMSRVPMGSAAAHGPGRPHTDSYRQRYEVVDECTAAERVAEKWGITREECDAFGHRSQTRARHAWDDGRFDTEVIPYDVPELDADGNATGRVRRVDRDEGLRETSLAALAALPPVANGVHTTASSSPITDGAAAVLLMRADKARALGLTPRARILDTCLVGVDPVLMLTGPIDVTHQLLERTGLSTDDLDTVEVNEAFASVVLAWEREVGPDPDVVNPNGGAIALGHPLGATGTRLVTSALHELERVDGTFGLVAMCSGGGLGTDTIIERVS